ncbi:MAG TPA: hypothetical protein DCW29_22015, partial [Janthinobacterium sp.]|nr:hypothetical protein [Janthinobacterium sp.]
FRHVGTDTATSAIIRSWRVLRQMNFRSMLHIHSVTAFPFAKAFAGLSLRETRIIDEYPQMSKTCQIFF